MGVIWAGATCLRVAPRPSRLSSCKDLFALRCTLRLSFCKNPSALQCTLRLSFCKNLFALWCTLRLSFCKNPFALRAPLRLSFCKNLFTLRAAPRLPLVARTGFYKMTSAGGEKGGGKVGSRIMHSPCFRIQLRTKSAQYSSSRLKTLDSRRTGL